MTESKQFSRGKFWADKLMDLANLSIAVLVFGQLVADKVRWDVVVFGFVVYALIGVISKNLIGISQTGQEVI